MKKLLFLFNPSAGRARIQSKIYSAIDYYTKEGYVVTVYPTQSAGDGYLFLKNQKEHFDHIVCSGGDGTLNEVISSFMEIETESTLGYIPFGSTNDFARSIGIPTNFAEALETSAKGKPFPIDVGKANDKYFVYVAAFGMFTDIPYTTSQKLKNVLGYLAYVLEGIKVISDLKTYYVNMKYNGEEIEGNFIVGLVTNSLSVGGFRYPLQSGVAFNDGVFEILLIKKPKSILELQAIIHSLLSEKIDDRYMVFIQTSKIFIESNLMDWTFDGEYGGKYEKFEIMNMRGAVKILVP